MIYLYINGEYIDCRDSYYKLLHMIVYQTTYITDATAQIKVGLHGEKWNIPFNVLRYIALNFINDTPTNFCIMGEVSEIRTVEDIEELMKRLKTERLFVSRGMVFSTASTTDTALR